jgi:asparagine synthase (glutamine-hydrolysing)
MRRRYFTPSFATVKPDIHDFRDAARMFEEVFHEAVRLRMRSDAPYGAYLSGGIDSAAVVAAMVGQSCVPVRTFSVGFIEPSYSEVNYARMVAQRFGTEHHELVVAPQEFIDSWPTAVLRRGAPVSEASDHSNTHAVANGVAHREDGIDRRGVR